VTERSDVALIKQNRLADGGSHAADTVGGGAFGFGNGGCLLFGVFCDGGFVEGGVWEGGFEGDTADCCVRPCDLLSVSKRYENVSLEETYHLRITVLAQHICVNGASGNTALLRKDAAQTCTVEESTTANNLFLGKTRKLLSKVSQDIHRVCDQEDDGVLAEGLHVLDC
jgi:hypothetical protein